eukprot:1159612-Pelagomonas_calceolata.AAC.12
MAEGSAVSARYGRDLSGAWAQPHCHRKLVIILKIKRTWRQRWTKPIPMIPISHLTSWESRVACLTSPDVASSTNWIPCAAWLPAFLACSEAGPPA